MTSLADFFSPPPWAYPLYAFELAAFSVIVFQVWLLWPLIKDGVRERLGLPPKSGKAKAPPVGT